MGGTVRIQAGDTEEIRSRYVNGLLVGVTGLAPTALIWRVSDGQFWTGSAYQVAVSPQAQVAVNAASLPGVYAVDFDTSGGGGASEEEHGVLASANNATVINSGQRGSIHVGGFIDNLDASVATGNASAAAAAVDAASLEARVPSDPADQSLLVAEHAQTQADISAIPSAPTAAANADAVWDEARAGHAGAGSFGENTGDAAMRGTDGANTVVPMTAALSQTEHDGTQILIGLLNNLSIAGVQTALTNQGYTAARGALLDNLDALISSRSSHSAAAVVTAILAAVLTSTDTVNAALSRLLVLDADTDSLRDFAEGRQRVDQVAEPHQFVNHRRTGSRSGAADSELKRFDMLDQAGAAINDANPMPQSPPSVFNKSEA